MATIRVTATAGPDGVVRLAIPVGEAGGEFEVVVTPMAPPLKTPEGRGWRPGFFETVIGSIDDDTFIRHPQGEYEKREPFE